MAENKHNMGDLKQMQSLPLSAKILMTKRRIREWYDFWNGDVYVSLSGGKDSTVLKHIVDSMFDDVPAVFVNTGLEYPEIQNFVREIKAGKYDCFSSNVEIVRPEMRFDEVIKKYGYPVISKRVGQTVETVKNGKKDGARWEMLNGMYKNKNGDPSQFNIEKWKFLADAPFKISSKCCNVMKKKPMHTYQKTTDKKPIIGTMASEGHSRLMAWLKTGCNAFDSKDAISKPLSFWTEQDVFHYIKKFNVPYCPVYGDIVVDDKPEYDGQINAIDYLGCYEPEDRLKTTGCNRTGCMFCMFGVHLEKEPNRFQQMKITHPVQYEYCMNQLGLKEVLKYINVPYE